MERFGTFSLKELVEKLKQARNPSERALLADQIGDILERALQNPFSMDGDVLRETFVGMMKLALNETNLESRESLFHALVTTSSLACARQEYVDPEPIARALDVLSEAELEYALYILGFSRRLAYLPMIERFLKHPSSNIRAVTRQAIQELQGST